MKQIDSLNIRPVAWDPSRSPGHDIRTLVGDGCALPMPDESYDIGFSNSVIEHVGSWERQQAFAAEIRRVAKDIWVQPAYGCPIEPHYMTPFIHYLPRGLQRRILRWGTVWGWVVRPNAEDIRAIVESTRLLQSARCGNCFRIARLSPRMLWVIPKSYIAVRTGKRGRRRWLSCGRPHKLAASPFPHVCPIHSGLATCFQRARMASNSCLGSGPALRRSAFCCQRAGLDVPTMAVVTPGMLRVKRRAVAKLYTTRGSCIAAPGCDPNRNGHSYSPGGWHAAHTALAMGRLAMTPMPRRWAAGMVSSMACWSAMLTEAGGCRRRRYRRRSERPGRRRNSR